jgi:hypothetical protein
MREQSPSAPYEAFATSAATDASVGAAHLAPLDLHDIPQRRPCPSPKHCGQAQGRNDRGLELRGLVIRTSRRSHRGQCGSGSVRQLPGCSVLSNGRFACSACPAPRPLSPRQCPHRRIHFYFYFTEGSVAAGCAEVNKVGPVSCRMAMLLRVSARVCDTPLVLHSRGRRCPSHTTSCPTPTHPGCSRESEHSSVADRTMAV